MKVPPAVLLIGFLAGCPAEPAAPKPLIRPQSVLLIRHAEKPTDAADPHLNPEGRKRAEALPELFKESAARPDPFPVPDFIFATKASKRSNRPAETVAPLARALKRDVNTEYANDDYPKLVTELGTNPKYQGKTVLVCWHHGNLPRLAAAFGAAGVPDTWNATAFDRVWVVAFDDKGKAKALVKRPQALVLGGEKE